MTEYDVGDLARVTAVFTDGETGAAVDPDTVSLQYRPDGDETITLVYGTDAEVVKDSTGHYHADIDLDSAGTWRYRWQSTGEGQAAEEGYFMVRTQMVV